MTVELRPLGVTCNIQCQYCYQNPQRDAGNVGRAYDLDVMKAAIEREGGPFMLFGGEPLLVPIADLEDLWAWGLDRYGSNGIQTNGALVTEAHVELFRRYQVQVGISIDGPGPLNDVRWAGTLERTREATARTEAAIEMLCRAGHAPSLIITLHRVNASAPHLPTLHAWVRDLDAMGVRSVRLHVLEVESGEVAAAYALTPEENEAAFRSFAALERRLEHLRFDVFEDVRNLLRGTDDQSTCVWNACDPYTTSAVRGVEGMGQSSNCGRTNKDGIDFVKAATAGFERSLALAHTPQEHGGCAGCRFLVMCKGQCPGTAIDGDWRNRSEQCDLWKALFRAIEEEMLDAGEVPLSASPERHTIERVMRERWAAGSTATIAAIRRELSAADGDGPDPSAAFAGGHGDAPHGDIPHGDSGPA